MQTQTTRHKHIKKTNERQVRIGDNGLAPSLTDNALQMFQLFHQQLIFPSFIDGFLPGLQRFEFVP
jgi:hypothetical protein